MLIRRATPTDLPHIVDLWVEFVDFHAEREPFFTRVPDADRLYSAHLSANINNPNWLVLVVELDDALVGFGNVILTSYPDFLGGQRYGYVDDVAVTASQRGKGIGQALYQHMETWLHEHGVHRAELSVIAGNALGHNFWKKQGFEPFISLMAKEL